TMYDGRTLHSREAVEMLRRTSATSSSRRGSARRSATRRRPCRAARCSSTSRLGRLRRPIASSRRRCSMARRRASMREGPLAELFRATEAAQRQADKPPGEAPGAGERSLLDEATVEAAAPVFDDPRPAETPPAEPTPSEAAAAPPETPAVPEAPVPARSAPPEPAPGAPDRPYAAPESERRSELARRLVEPAPRMRTTPRPDSAAYLAVIRVVGVGGAGLNA